MIPKKYGPILFSLILSGLMSLLVSGIATFRAAGLVDGVFSSYAGRAIHAESSRYPCDNNLRSLAVYCATNSYRLIWGRGMRSLIPVAVELKVPTLIWSRED